MQRRSFAGSFRHHGIFRICSGDKDGGNDVGVALSASAATLVHFRNRARHACSTIRRRRKLQ